MRNGFSFIELVMVVLVIGILATLSLPRLQKRFELDLLRKEKNFLDRFTDELQKSGYFDQSKEDTKKRDVYGDRRRSSGDTVADLGGGNTAVTPDSASLVQAQMAMANQQQQPGLGGQLAGAGAAAGVSMIPGVGPFLAPVAGNLVSGLFG